ncbi:hypothetical protein Drorol1_Dr00003780, partial [Drosera rotundifolia]
MPDEVEISTEKLGGVREWAAPLVVTTDPVGDVTVAAAVLVVEPVLKMRLTIQKKTEEETVNTIDLALIVT